MAATKKKKPAKKEVQYKSFVRSEGPKPFVNFKVTQQTAYWLILGVLILALGTWAMYLTIKVQRVYDAVEANNSANSTYVMPMNHRR
jgi:hypothetical protein